VPITVAPPDPTAEPGPAFAVLALVVLSVLPVVSVVPVTVTSPDEALAVVEVL